MPIIADTLHRRARGPMQAYFVFAGSPMPDRDSSLSTGFEIVPQTSLIEPWLPAIGQSDFHSRPFASQLQASLHVHASSCWLGWIKEFPQHDQMGDRKDRSGPLHFISIAPSGRDLRGRCESHDGETDDFIGSEIEPAAINY